MQLVCSSSLVLCFSIEVLFSFSVDECLGLCCLSLKAVVDVWPLFYIQDTCHLISVVFETSAC